MNILTKYEDNITRRLPKATLDFQPKTIAELSTEHPEYQMMSPQWRTIETLTKGFPAIKRDILKYLPKRPAEDDELHKLRISKLAYTPIMQRIVGTYVGKLVSSGVSFPEKAGEVWDELRENNSRLGETKRSEMAFMSEVLMSILHFGQVIVAIDVPDVQARSAYELRASKVLPYFTVLSPLDIINWGEGWMVMRQFIQKSEPFQPVSTFALFTYVGDGVRVEYEVPVQTAEMLDIEENRHQTISRVMWKGEWLKPDENMRFDVTNIVEGVGMNRITSTRVSDDKWLCLSLYNKQIQHLRMENAWSDTGYLAGTVQRIFTPEDQKPNDDPRATFSRKDVSKELSKAGNQHILIGKGYSFVESSGTALANLQGMLDKIEAQMSEIANLHFASGQKGTIQQSGASKRLDMALLEGNLTGYGSLVLDLYNELLLKVAVMFKMAPVEVTGLSDFTQKDVTDVTTAISTISMLPDFPQIGRAFLYRKLLDDMEISLSDSDKLVLEQQLVHTPDIIVTEPPMTSNKPG